MIIWADNIKAAEMCNKVVKQFPWLIQRGNAP